MVVAVSALVVSLLASPSQAAVEVSPSAGDQVAELSLGRAPGGHIPEETTLVPVPLLSRAQLSHRLTEEHATGKPGIPLAEAYAWARKPISSLASVCVFIVNGDHVHVTNNEASGHGWWLLGTCPPKTKANTRIELVETLYGKEFLVAAGEKRGRYAGSGSANRANARSMCATHARTKWYSLITVDLIRRTEVPMRAHTSPQYLKCK